jgi:mannose-1-phosphate guanylyltransferase / mannose-6-phosphate isomerase
MKVIILAGGEGSRLWPFSTVDLPKQFLDFNKSETLFEKTLNRYKNVKFIDEVSVVTNAKYAPIAEAQIKKVNPKFSINIIIEPFSKNTLPAIALSLKYLEEKLKVNENEKILVVPSDHIITPSNKFIKYLETLNNYESLDDIITFGIFTKKAETGFGYIKKAKRFDENLFHIEKFVEKPNKILAEKFFKDSSYCWNSGMFLFSTKVFKNEMKIYEKEISKNFEDFSYLDFFNNFYDIKNISFDYGILEKSKKVKLFPLDINWSDMGCWDGVYDVLEKDENKNVLIGNVINIDTKNSLIFSQKRLVSTIDLENVLVVEAEDAIFLAKKGSSQKVKMLLSEMQKKEKQLLVAKLPVDISKKDCLINTIEIKIEEKISKNCKEEKFYHYFIIDGRAKVIINSKREKFFISNNSFSFSKNESIEIVNDSNEKSLKLVEIIKTNQKSKCLL